MTTAPRILLLGDAHGDLGSIAKAVRWARDTQDCTAAIQVGDFGFYAEGMKAQLAKLGRFALPLHVIDGNHEEHAWLMRVARATRGECRAKWSKEFDLHYHPRGTVSELCGLRIAWCGGAAHADRPQEYALRATAARPLGPPKDPLWSSWVSTGDVQRTVTAIAGRPIDLLVTHSCPAGIGVGMGTNGSMAMQAMQHIWKFGLDPGPEHDLGEQSLTDLWHALPHRPKHWIYGHWHTELTSKVNDTTFHCVGGIDRRLRHICPRVRIYEVSTQVVTAHALTD